jgi:hypothetical protein
MSKAQHTPGPWKADGYIVSGDWHCSSVVARVASSPRAFDDTSLIAAAPDLLAALKEMADDYPVRSELGSEIYKKARAAIAKATDYRNPGNTACITTGE